MNNKHSITFTIIALLLLPATLQASSLYLKNGDEIECESYRRQGNRVLVRIAADSEIDLAVDEVDLARTPGLKPAVAPKPRTAAAPAAALPEPDVADAAEPPVDTSTWWRAGETPSGFLPGTPQLRSELSSVFARYNRAAESGDFEAFAKQMPAYQAKRTRQELAKVKDKKEMQKRKKVMQGMAIKDFQPRECAVSPDGAIAALSGTGRELHEGKYRQGTGTVKFVKENGEWRVAFQIW